MTEKKDKQIALIVDDVKDNIRILIDLLKPEYKTFFADNGEKALKLAESKTPDLILLDIVMPEMDGFETCRRLKKNPTTRDIPVLFLSGLSDIASKVEGFNLGAVDFVTKPFQPEEVLARVKTHLTLKALKKGLEKKNDQLQEALDNIETLRGLLPICSKCKNIRNDDGYWQQIELFIIKHSDAEFSHGLCPECMEELYGDQKWYQDRKTEMASSVQDFGNEIESKKEEEPLGDIKKKQRIFLMSEVAKNEFDSLAVELGKTKQDLMAEAVTDLFLKHGKPPLT